MLAAVNFLNSKSCSNNGTVLYGIALWLVLSNIAVRFKYRKLHYGHFFQDFLQTRLKVSLRSIVISRTKARHRQTHPRPLLRTQRLYPKNLL